MKPPDEPEYDPRDFEVLADFSNKELYAELYRRGITISDTDSWHYEFKDNQVKTYAEMDQDAEAN